MKVFYIFIPALALLTVTFNSCKKQDDFLNQKPNVSLSTISSLNDCQLLLNNEDLFNTNDISLGEISSDDFYLSTGMFARVQIIDQNAYTWAKSIYPVGQNDYDWSLAYQRIYYSNAVLDALGTISHDGNQQTIYNELKGKALFFRGLSFYNLVQTFALPYDSATATKDLGIPLRLSSDLNVPTTRSSESDCYRQIVSDVTAAIPLLSDVPQYRTSPSKAACYGLLGRIYLAMANYSKALSAASTCLSYPFPLVDYNTITPAARSLIINGYFTEDIFHSTLYSYLSITPVFRSLADTNLYKMFDSTDLRKKMLYVQNSTGLYFRGTYDYRAYAYDGIASDEILLIRAECYARASQFGLALADLNTLLENRYRAGTFVPYTLAATGDIVALILTERRKELQYRGLRWTDLRRINKEPKYAVTLSRFVNGVSYTLLPNDIRYALPIPDNEIEVSGIPQNNR
ncbi:MAG TPA: RagB/SusD family nutrient uptake outer membrane protein [Puia sp.]